MPLTKLVDGKRMKMSADEKVSFLAEQPTQAEMDAERKAGVKAEAYRRITAYLPDWKQRNLTARAAEFGIKLAQGYTLTATDEAEIASGQLAWDHVKAIRSASDVLEALAEPPKDFTDDKYWP